MIFLTTHRNPHGCLKCADGDAMLMVLEVPALPSKQAHHDEVSVDVFLYLNVRISLLEASVSSLQQGLHVFFFLCNLALQLNRSNFNSEISLQPLDDLPASEPASSHLDDFQ